MTVPNTNNPHLVEILVFGMFDKKLNIRPYCLRGLDKLQKRYTIPIKILGARFSYDQGPELLDFRHIKLLEVQNKR